MKIKTIILLMLIPFAIFAQDTSAIQIITELQPVEQVEEGSEELKTAIEIILFSLLFYAITWLSGKVGFLADFIQDKQRFRFFLMTAVSSVSGIILTWVMGNPLVLEILGGIVGSITFYNTGIEGLAEKYPAAQVLKTPKSFLKCENCDCKDGVCNKKATQESLTD